eukprot:GHVS01004354.1.p3 GENE.GHVS01004354.1~~GHVS01004354.1.p3  ORF type:complete len:136 (-),score=22.52 GHVS01004354.1:473-880(-)
MMGPSSAVQWKDYFELDLGRVGHSSAVQWKVYFELDLWVLDARSRQCEEPPWLRCRQEREQAVSGGQGVQVVRMMGPSSAVQWKDYFELDLGRVGPSSAVQWKVYFELDLWVVAMIIPWLRGVAMCCQSNQRHQD